MPHYSDKTSDVYEDVQITICIPTWNRGNKLLKKILEWQPLFNKSYPVLILDNSSDKHEDSYHKIKLLADTTNGLDYVRHKENILFEGNFLSMFSIVKTPFFIVVSDEDTPNFQFMSEMSGVLSGMHDVGAIRPSMEPLEGVQPRQSTDFGDKSFAPGAEAIKQFGLNGNYISGAIYNRKLLSNLGFHKRLEKNMNEQRIYPHLYMNILAASSTKTQYTSGISCFEGEPESIGNHQTDYFGAFSYGQRLDQFVALRNAILEGVLECGGEFDSKGFFNCYMHLSHKYLKLVSYVNMLMYDAHAMDPRLLTHSFVLFCISCAKPMPGFEENKNTLINVIGKYEKQFNDLYESNKEARADFMSKDKERLAALSAAG